MHLQVLNYGRAGVYQKTQGSLQNESRKTDFQKSIAGNHCQCYAEE